MIKINRITFENGKVSILLNMGAKYEEKAWLFLAWLSCNTIMSDSLMYKLIKELDVKEYVSTYIIDEKKDDNRLWNEIMLCNLERTGTVIRNKYDIGYYYPAEEKLDAIANNLIEAGIELHENREFISFDKYVYYRGDIAYERAKISDIRFRKGIAYVELGTGKVLEMNAINLLEYVASNGNDHNYDELLNIGYSDIDSYVRSMKPAKFNNEQDKFEMKILRSNIMKLGTLIVILDGEKTFYNCDYGTNLEKIYGVLTSFGVFENIEVSFTVIAKDDSNKEAIDLSKLEKKLCNSINEDIFKRAGGHPIIATTIYALEHPELFEYFKKGIKDAID